MSVWGYFQLNYIRLHQHSQCMEKTAKKPTNKAKFSLYLDKDLMAKIGRVAKKDDRSVNYKIEKALAREFSFNLVS